MEKNEKTLDGIGMRRKVKGAGNEGTGGRKKSEKERWPRDKERSWGGARAFFLFRRKKREENGGKRKRCQSDFYGLLFKIEEL